MAAIVGVLAFITIAAFLVILYATVVVTIGSHQEERRWSFLRRQAPTPIAEQARLIVGRYVRKTEPEPAAQIPEEAIPWYERSPRPVR